MNFSYISNNQTKAAVKKYFDYILKFMKFGVCNRENQTMDFKKTKAACNFFLDKASEEGYALTPMQVIKLVYFAHGYSLAILNRPLIDDRVEAWKFGSVIPSLYHSLKAYGAGGITAPLVDTSKIRREDVRCLSPAELYEKYPNLKISKNAFSEQELDVLSAVWQVYKGKSGFELSSYIHKPDTPWTKIWNSKGKYKYNTEIDNNTIRDYYSDKISSCNEN